MRLVLVLAALAGGARAAACMKDGYACTGTYMEDVAASSQGGCVNACRLKGGCGCVTWLKEAAQNKCRLMNGTALEDRAMPNKWAAQLMTARCFFTDDIAEGDWAPCSHTTCKVEQHQCTHIVHGAHGTLQQLTSRMAGHITFPHAYTSLMGEAHDHAYHHARTPSCRNTTSLRVYHHAQEQKGTVHRCGVHGAGGCTCECALKETADVWNLLGDSASGLYAPTTSTCPLQGALVAAQRCSTRELTGTNENPAIDTTDYAVCRDSCGKMGAGCVEYEAASGLCRCYDMHHPLAPAQRPVFDAQSAHVASGQCTDDHARSNRTLAAEYYAMAQDQGSAYATKRLDELAALAGSAPLVGHRGKRDYHATTQVNRVTLTNKHADYDKLCAQADRNAIAAPQSSAEHCQCRKHYWRVQLGGLLMTKCRLCPWHSHAKIGVRGTLSCACDDGYDAVASGTEIQCVVGDGSVTSLPVDQPIEPWQADLPWTGLSGEQLLQRFVDLGHLDA